MDRELMTVLIVLMICITIISLAVLGFNSYINYTKPDGTSLTVTSTKAEVIADVEQVEVLTDSIK